MKRAIRREQIGGGQILDLPDGFIDAFRRYIRVHALQRLAQPGEQDNLTVVLAFRCCTVRSQVRAVEDLVSHVPKPRECRFFKDVLSHAAHCPASRFPCGSIFLISSSSSARLFSC